MIMLTPEQNLHNRFHTLVSGLLALACLLTVTPLSAAERVGIVDSQPASGPFVKTDQGFMVPYTVTIPGTDVTFEMVPVPGGTFQLGSPEDEADRGDDEGPQVSVTVEPFWIGKHEVTWAEYKLYTRMYNLFKDLAAQGVRNVTDENKVDAVTVPTPLYDPTYTYALGEEDRHPAVTMSQFAARQYTKWLSRLAGNLYRLPSEVEWEYACRAGSTTAYSFGDDPDQLDEYAWYYENSDESYHEVGGKKPNAWGIHDMHGNVAELVLDQYAEDAYQNLSSDGVKAADAVNWPEEDIPHTIRGGGWDADPENLRSAARGQTDDWRDEDPNLPRSPWWFTDEPSLAVGFRIVRPLNEANVSAELRQKYFDVDCETLEFAVGDRLLEGRGVQGLVDPQLGDLIKENVQR